jgi:hypothetical protein
VREGVEKSLSIEGLARRKSSKQLRLQPFLAGESWRILEEKPAVSHLITEEPYETAVFAGPEGVARRETLFDTGAERFEG